MTVQQLINALNAIPKEHRDAIVWQGVIDGRCETKEVAFYLAGRLADDEGPVLVVLPDIEVSGWPQADILIVPGDEL